MAKTKATAQVAKVGLPPTKPRALKIGPDVRGKVRVYSDLDIDAAVELEVLAARRRITKKAMLELLVTEAVEKASKVGI